MNKKKVCWKITTKCNQNCKGCFGYQNIPELSFEDNKRILERLIKMGLTNITWTGGEAVLYPDVIKLMEFAKENRIENKLITNGIFLSQNSDYAKELISNLEYLTLSIDSASEKINLELGKKEHHFDIVKNVLESTKNDNVKININTVISEKNINNLDELGEFLSDYKIDTWKFLKFMPLKGRAIENRSSLEIFNSDASLRGKIRKFKKYENINQIKYKTQKELEKNILILPNGNIVKTNNGNDINLGNALYDDIDFTEKEEKIGKIRTLIVHDDEKIRNKLIQVISNIDYAEIIGVTENGADAYNQIINLKPEMVFTKFELEKMDGLEIMKKSKEEMAGLVPIFNIISDKNINDNLREAIEVVGDNLNALIQEDEPFAPRLNDIFSEYKEYKEYKKM